jgi:hypothetical protein
MTMRAPLLLLVPLLLAPCRPAAEDGPSTPALESLESGRYDPRFGLEYWTGRLDERRLDDEWDRAVAFCRERHLRRYPNCRTVRLLETASRIPGFPGEEAP